MTPTLLTDIAALPGWNAPMLLLLAKATLILVAALGITVAMQRGSAGARHLVWLVTLGTLLFVPALAAWSPLKLEILPARAVSAPVEAPAPAAPAVESSSDLSDKSSELTSLPSAAYPAPVVTNETAPSRIDAFTLALMVWGGVVLLLGGWLLWGAMAVHRIVRNAHPLDTNDWLTPLYEIADRLELEQPPLLLGSNEAKMPFACGFLRPTIVLPAESESWTPDRRHAVLLHELAHVKRRDLVGHTLGRIACAVYWFHPLVWTAAKQLRNESERACDDLALSCGARASDYAEHLLDIVTSVRHDSTPAVALAMARRKEFEGRMLAILDPELRHSTPSRLQSMALIGSLALIAVVVGAAAPAPRASNNVALMSNSAVQNPEYDKDFTPRDIEDREKDKQRSKALDKAIAKSVNKSVNQSVYTATHEAVSQSVSSSVSKSVTNSVNKSVTSSINDIGTNFGNAVGKSVAKSVGEFLGAAVGAIGVEASAEAVAEAKADAIADAKAEADADGPSLAALERLRGKTNGRLQVAKPDERPVLLARILKTEGDPQLRRIAAWGLSEYANNTVAADALAEAVRRDTDASVREMSAWALGDGEAHSAVSALSNAVRSDANEKVRAISAWSLGRIEREDALPALSAALSDASASVRMRALWAIGSIEPRQVPSAAVERLRDPSERVRELAAWVLFRAEDPATIPALNAALRAEKNPELQMAYIKALSALGEKSVDAISGLLTSSDPKIKQMAIRALAGGRGAGPWPWPWPEPRPYP